MAVVSRYTISLHVLALLAYVAERSSANNHRTSEFIANSVNTNPVFIRRILSVLSKAGLVSVRYGTGAGWRIAGNPEEITFLQVYEAVEEKPLFEYHHSTPNARCPIGAGIQPALKPYYDEAEQAMKANLAKSTIADLLKDTMLFSNMSIEEADRVISVRADS
ncbi:Rrf2 family transcriptional regulator [Paenibacillus filicis]|uniref:Rrf2 family transcriptional regulator n=1 Tax=Paenibacillus filicis TaxID=669464 RepID=A0ABU9DM28_9BACL